MYCKKCGTKQKDGQKFCPKCGTPFNNMAFQSIPNNESEPETVTPVSTFEESFDRNKDNFSQYQNAPQVSNKRLYRMIALILFIFVLIGAGGYFAWMYLNSSDGNVLVPKAATSDVDGIPFKSSEKGKWGMLRPDGTILFEEEFKDTPTLAHDGRFMVRNGNGLWEIFTATENPEKVGDEYVSIGEFYNGVAPAVKKNEKISLIDRDGNVIAFLERSGSHPIISMENFRYGYAIFRTTEAEGIVNTKGEILLDAKRYFRISQITKNRFLAIDIKYKDDEDFSNCVLQLIDPYGNIKGSIRMSKYDDIVFLSDGYFAVEQSSDGEKLYGIMNIDGEVIIKPSSKIKGIVDYRKEKFIFSNGECLGVRNIKNEILIRAKYDGLTWASDDLLWAASVNEGRTEWQLIDLENNKITRDSYTYALPFYDGKHAFVQITDKTWGIINNEGEELKNIPDIYTVSAYGANTTIISDFVDIDAIIADIKMTNKGFGGFGINMKPAELLKVYNEYCDPSSRIEINPSATHTDKLAYTKNVMEGIDVYVELYYSGYISERGGRKYEESLGEWIGSPDKWTEETPKYIKFTVSGDKISGKTNLLYKKLLAKVKSYGQVYKENDRACLIVQKNNTGLLLVNTGERVWGMIITGDYTNYGNIEQYSENETRSGPAYAVEVVDTVAVDYY